jgi:hypothetical protein
MLLRIGDALSPTILRRSLNLRVVAAVLASAPTVAIGQTAQSSNQQIRQQIQQQRINAILGTGTGSLTSRKAFTALDGGPGAPASFAFDLTGPLLFNSIRRNCNVRRQPRRSNLLEQELRGRQPDLLRLRRLQSRQIRKRE